MLLQESFAYLVSIRDIYQWNQQSQPNFRRFASSISVVCSLLRGSCPLSLATRLVCSRHRKRLFCEKLPLSLTSVELPSPPLYTASVLSRLRQQISGTQRKVHTEYSQVTTCRSQVCTWYQALSPAPGKILTGCRCRTAHSQRCYFQSQLFWSLTYFLCGVGCFLALSHSEQCSFPLSSEV